MSRKLDSARSGPNLWLALGLLSTIAPHMRYFPMWISALCASMLLLRVMVRPGTGAPGWMLQSIALLAAAGVFREYGTLFARDPGIALFGVLIVLKLFEPSKDTTTAAFLGYFYALTPFFDSQGMISTLFTASSVLLLTAAILGFNQRASRPRLLPALKVSGALLIQGLPFMLLLFLLFPRISGPLWMLPQRTASGVTGLSDSMSPGAISSLGKSDAVAFRAMFESMLPKPSELYWRGPVLGRFDGRTWRGEQLGGMLRPYQVFGEKLSYTITLEPSEKSWLFALDVPTITPPGSRITADFQILSAQPVKERLRYRMESYPNYRYGIDESPLLLQAMLQIPPHSNPRSVALAEQWKQNSPDPNEILNQALFFFQEGDFTYTLQPPLLSQRNSIDDFLFHSRAGFCEHFASSFVFLMRAAGIPARVVTGYQGGEYNPLGRYFIVRQADAHAWAEVWLKDRGWIRVDPTAAVSPSRVQGGITTALPDAEQLPFMMRSHSAWARQFRFGIDATANMWNQWVVGYGQEKQNQLMSRFGLDDWERMVGALAAGIALFVSALALFLLAGAGRAPRDPVQRAYLKFCNKLQDAGITRHSHEGPLDLLAKIEAARPDLASAARPIISLYIGMRYGKQPLAAKQLAKLVNDFRP